MKLNVAFRLDDKHGIVDVIISEDESDIEGTK
jgi:hypothetical protein